MTASHARPAHAIAASLLLAAIYLIAPTSAFAVASYVFEPTLSLTGNCSTTKLDPVPDPGVCPIPPGTTFSGSPGADHPSEALRSPGVTTDQWGDLYVANIVESKGRIDVFDPEGFFITEFSDPAGPQSVAVDSEGNVYTFDRIAGGERQVRRFPPTVYKPESGEIEYGAEPQVVVDRSTKNFLPQGLGPESSVAVNPTSDRLYVDSGLGVSVFGSAKEENKLLEAEVIHSESSTSIAIDSAHKRIYISDWVPVTFKSRIRIFELEAPHKEVGEIDGSTTPNGEFLSGEGFLRLDVDEDTGHVFLGDAAAGKVYELEEDGTYLATIEHSFNSIPFGEIAVDDGKFSPHPETEAYLYVPSDRAPSTGHVYAFKPKEQGPPIVESTSLANITATEVELHATINPDGLSTEYKLEYVTQQQFGESFWTEATVAGTATLPKGAEGVEVSAGATGLEPGTAYRFRAFAENGEGTDEGEKAFSTFPAKEQFGPCGNDPLRIGLSALLADCRAYELVTPPNTNGLPPSGVGFTGVYFPTLEASPDGSRASFLIEGGTIPGNEGAGAFNGDLYLATRGSEGWTSKVTGPSGEEAIGPNPGSVSPDQTYSFWEDIKTFAVYIHYADGHSELVGHGSLGEDPNVLGDLMTKNAGHIIFSTIGSGAVQLEPDAPPSGTGAVYDRSAEGPTHVVSLLPGDETPKAGEDAIYLGASEDGEGIAFKLGGRIYVRLHNAETFEVAGSGAEFAGVSEEGKRVFYMEGGNLFAYDTEAEKAIAFSASGDVTPVNVATGGTRAYFVSPSVLTSEPNPSNEKAKAGEENLYLSEEGQISFVARVTKRDVEGEERPDGQIGGLGLWVLGLKMQRPAIDPSRTTPAGATLLFESRANLTNFEGNGFVQIYRYDAVEDRLDCLSCSPTGTPPTSDASLQTLASGQPSIVPASYHAKIQNLTPDGNRAFFQTAEPLVVGDTDGQLDVYEWEEEGVGSCARSGGCVYLISGGHSASPDYLFAMSSSGNDVFFRTSDLLLPRDEETTLSLYDARVDGGFPEATLPIPCEESATCHQSPPAPNLPEPTSSVVSPEENIRGRHCPKGKHRAKRHGKIVCLKNHHSHHKKKHPRAGSGGKGAGK